MHKESVWVFPTCWPRKHAKCVGFPPPDPFDREVS